MLADLVADGVPAGQCRVRLEADLRFDRQGSELTVPVDDTDGGRLRIDGLEERFKAEYARRFGEGAIAMGVPVELMTLRAIGSATDEEIADTIDAATGARRHADCCRVACAAGAARTARGGNRRARCTTATASAPAPCSPGPRSSIPATPRCGCSAAIAPGPTRAAR